MARKLSFSTKLQAFVLLLVTVIVGSLSLVFLNYLMYLVKDSFFGVTSGFAYYLLRSNDISGAIAHHTLPQVEKQIAGSLELQEEILYVALISSQGEVVLDSTGGDVAKLYRDDRDHNWLTTREEEKNFFLRDVRLRNKTFDVANVIVPIFFQGKVWGGGIIGVSANYLFKYAMPRAAYFVLFLFVIFLVLSTISLILLIRHLLMPVRELTDGAERIFEQDFETEVAVYGEDDIGKLAETFNRLMSYLKDVISRLQGQSLMDPVTNCYQEKFFLRQLGVELERAQRFHDPLCVGFLEIQNIPTQIAKFGPAVGPQLIATFAQILKKSTRHIDVLAHGEQGRFDLILPKTNPEGAAVVVERILEAAGRATVPDELGRPMIHVSFNYGLVYYLRDDDAPQVSVEQLLTKAENLLQRAKSRGPNRGDVVPYFQAAVTGKKR